MRTRYYEEIPRWQAERNLHAAHVLFLQHGGHSASQTIAEWQQLAKWVRNSTADSVRSLREFLRRNLDPRWGKVNDQEGV